MSDSTARPTTPSDQQGRARHLFAGPRHWLTRRRSLRWRGLLAVFVGGMLGGGARTAVSAAIPAGDAVPWGTLVANMSGALLLGYLLTRLLRASSRTTLMIPLVCTGLLGAYTTFSTFSVETVRLAAAGRSGLAAAYAGGSLLAGLAAAAAGIRLAEWRT